MNYIQDKSIIIVDDEPDFLDILGEYLQELGAHIHCASDARQALKLMEHVAPVDLVLSDINMPGKKGYELLDEISRISPQTTRCLITAYEVSQFIKQARMYNIGTIITKTTPFNFAEFESFIQSLLSRNIFGLQQLLPAEEVQRFTITHSDHLEHMTESIVSGMQHAIQKKKFTLGLPEMLNNAFYYGACELAGDDKDNWPLQITIPTSKGITVQWGATDELAAVSITDSSGKLRKKDVLYWLERNMIKDNRGISIGFFDNHGKGLYISRETSDRLIINIIPEQKTEIVVVNYAESTYRGHSPLWINEIPAMAE